LLTKVASWASSTSALIGGTVVMCPRAIAALAAVRVRAHSGINRG
jgi:F0F1-type ATP synthase assembly protein I